MRSLFFFPPFFFLFFFLIHMFMFCFHPLLADELDFLISMQETSL